MSADAERSLDDQAMPRVYTFGFDGARGTSRTVLSVQHEDGTWEDITERVKAWTMTITYALDSFGEAIRALVSALDTRPTEEAWARDWYRDPGSAWCS